jgi:hypothetical protein
LLFAQNAGTIMRELIDAELDAVGGGQLDLGLVGGSQSVVSELSSVSKLVTEATKGLGALFVLKQIASTIFLDHDAPR